MAHTADDLTAIDKALAQKEKSVQFGDRLHSFRSTEELLRMRAIIARELAGRTRLSIGVSSKGFGC